jgi:hypothetical protein
MVKDLAIKQLQELLQMWNMFFPIIEKQRQTLQKTFWKNLNWGWGGITSGKSGSSSIIQKQNASLQYISSN